MQHKLIFPELKISLKGFNFESLQGIQSNVMTTVKEILKNYFQHRFQT
jgi:hypothetical protein